MGLMIHSLEELPEGAERGYYIYVLDYGWNEPLSDILSSNFGEMGKQASQNNAVVFRGTVGSHFEDEVLSWHHVNGQSSEDILPAILITTKHPKSFHSKSSRDATDNMILIPLRNYCKTSSDVIELIRNVFADIKKGKELKNFRISEEVNGGIGRAIVDSVILEPNISGVGIKLKPLLSRLFKK